jgi:hypothetical protein
MRTAGRLVEGLVRKVCDGRAQRCPHREKRDTAASQKLSG